VAQDRVNWQNLRIGSTGRISRTR